MKISWFLDSPACCYSFFAVAYFSDDSFDVAIVVAVVANIECSDFAALAAGVDIADFHATFVDFVSEVSRLLLLLMQIWDSLAISWCQ